MLRYYDAMILGWCDGLMLQFYDTSIPDILNTIFFLKSIQEVRVKI